MTGQAGLLREALRDTRSATRDSVRDMSFDISTIPPLSLAAAVSTSFADSRPSESRNLVILMARSWSERSGLITSSCHASAGDPAAPASTRAAILSRSMP